MCQAAALPDMRVTIARHLEQFALLLACMLPLLLALGRATADITTCLIAVLFLLRSLLAGHWRWLRRPEILLLGTLWLFIMLSALLTPYDTDRSFKSALVWVRFPLCYAALRYWLFATPQALALAGKIGVPIVLVIAVDTAIQYLTGLSPLSGHHITSQARLTGILGNPNIGHLLLKIGLPVAGIAAYALCRQERYRRLWLVAAACFGVFAVIMVSGERSSALLALLALGTIGLALFIALPRLRRLVIAGMGTVAALVVFLVLTQPIVQHRTAFMLQQLSDFENTYYGQLEKAAIGLWLKYPFTGIGPQQFVHACQENMPSMHVFYCDMHPHNIYLDWLAASGSIGFLLFVTAMGVIVRSASRKLRFSGDAAVIAAFTLAALSVLLFPLIITQSAFSNWPAALFWYSLAMAASLPVIGKEARA